MLQLSKHNKYPIIIILAAVISLGLIFGVIIPSVTKMKSANEQIELGREKMERLLGEGQSVTENQKNLARVKSEMAVLDNVWLKTGEELKFITDLENKAADNGIEQTIVFDNTLFAAGTEIKIIPLGLDISGSLANLLNYLADLEAFDYYININQLQITAGSVGENKKYAKQVVDELSKVNQKASNDDVILSVRINATTYWK